MRDVVERGDAALREWALRLDGNEPARAEPGDGLPTEALLALADSVRRWHELQRPPDVSLEISPGVELERRWVPLRSVGIYVPRGLVSTLVMVGIDEVWAIGGPQAIAALAYGTESIARVDKIVGPGNAYVNEAKLLVAGDVVIDLPAGPSEVVVLVGPDADRHVAELELAAQAEHGPDTVCRIVDVKGDAERALEEIEALAPEHLVLLGADAEALVPRIRNAGAVFVGPWSAVAAGDYATGGNHVLPTGGWARAVGGLGLESFMKPVTVQRLTRGGLASVRPVVEALAAVEGMPAHAEAMRR